MRKEKTIIPKVPLNATEIKLVQLVDDHKDELIQLLSDLIAIDTRTYEEKIYSDIHPAVNYCQKFCEKYDISTQILESPHVTDPNLTWPNLIASIESNQPGKKLGFMGHLDIVPFSKENWDKNLDPLKATIRGNKLFGRGSADMKSGVVAQMMALALLKKSGINFKGECQMIFTPDEEIASDYGASFLADNYFELADADARIISEPTGQPPIKNPAIIIGEKGANWLRLKFHGASGHGSFPKPKSNAMNKAVRFIYHAQKKLKFTKITPPMTKLDLIKGILSRFRLRDILSTQKKPSTAVKQTYDEEGSNLSPFFKTSISFTMIDAGKKVNVIPDTCELHVDIRTIPGSNNQTLINDLVKYCTKLGYRIQIPEKFINSQKSNSKIQKRLVDIELEAIYMNEGGAESKESEICSTLAEQYEKVFQTQNLFFFSPGMTDASDFRKKNIKNIVVFGPSGDNAHDADEFIYIDDFIKCTKVYLLTAYNFLK